MDWNRLIQRNKLFINHSIMLNTSVSFVLVDSFGLIYSWILYLPFSSNETVILLRNCIDIITEVTNVCSNFTYIIYLRSSSMTKIKNQLTEQTENI